MSEMSGIGKSVGIQQQQTTQRRFSTGDVGLDSIKGSKSLEKSKLSNVLDLVGSSKDSVGLSSISRVRSDSSPLGKQGILQQEVVPLKPKVSPFSSDKSTVKSTEKDQADITPDKTWAQKIRQYATGAKKSMMFPGHHESKMSALETSFKTAATTKTQEAGGGKDVRAFMLVKEFKSQLDKGDSLLPTGASSLSAGAQKIRQTHMVLQSLLAQVGKQDSPVTAEDVLRAVSLLKPEDRQAVMRADALTGGHLYSLAYTAQKGDQTLQPMFNELKVDAATAQASLTLDKHDPSGKATQVFTDFINHLAEQGYPQKVQEDFKTHLAFQMNLGDVSMPDTAKAGWQQDFTAQLVSRFCSIESTSAADRLRLLDMPKEDLLLTVAHALGKSDGADPPMLMRREGDVHILRTLRDNPDRFGVTLGDTDKAVFQRLLPRLERGTLNPELLLSELKAGKSLGDIETTLNGDLRSRSTREFQRLDNWLNDNKDISATRMALYQKRKALLETLKVGGLSQQEVVRLEKAISDMKQFDLALDPNKADFSKSQIEAKLRAFDIDPDSIANDSMLSRLDAKIEKERSKLMGPDGVNAQARMDEYQEMRDFFSALDQPAMERLMERFGTDVIGQLRNVNIDSVRQLSLQLKSFDNPGLLKKGLEDLVTVLPTAGKSLESFHWVDSTVRDMVDLAQTIRQQDAKFSLANNPIIILDQSDASNQGRWDENHTYLQGLAEKHKDLGLNIVHVSMADINRMIQGSGLEKLFDTTGQNYAGYGGARNMAFLLTPLIAKTLQEGKTLDTIKPNTLQQAIKEASLGHDAPKLFMGDDTDYLRPGAMYAKAGLNTLYGDEYFVAVSKRDGRDTMGVSSANAKLTPKSMDMITHNTTSFSNSMWNTKQGQPGMGSVMGSPRFCFDIPTGAEEGHVTTPKSHVDFLSRVSHLSGDRMKSVSDNIRGYLNYSMGTEMFKSLADGIEQTPWNRVERRSEFQTLGDIFREAAKPEVTQQTSVGFLGRMSEYFYKESPFKDGPVSLSEKYASHVDDYLREHPDISPEERDTLNAIKATYQNVTRQSKLIQAFGESVLKALVPKHRDLSQQQLEQALTKAIAQDDGADLKQAIKNAKSTLSDQQINLTAPENQILRDFVLIMDSRCGGGFADLAAKLVA